MKYWVSLITCGFYICGFVLTRVSWNELSHIQLNQKSLKAVNAVLQSSPEALLRQGLPHNALGWVTESWE